MDKEKMIKVENLVDYGDIKKGTICKSKSSDYNFFNQEGKEVRSFGITEDIESFFEVVYKRDFHVRSCFRMFTLSYHSSTSSNEESWFSWIVGAHSKSYCLIFETH